MRIFCLLDQIAVVLLRQFQLALRFFTRVVVHLEERADDEQVHEVGHEGGKNEANQCDENDVDSTCEGDRV